MLTELKNVEKWTPSVYEIIHAGGKPFCISCQRPGGNLQTEIVRRNVYWLQHIFFWMKIQCFVYKKECLTYQEESLILNRTQ